MIGDIVLSAASQQYGGFTVPSVENILAPYAEKSYAKYLEKYRKLGLPEEKFISIVAFSANSTIKVKSKDHVVYILQVKKVIKSYKKPVFTQDEIKQLADRIKTINEASSDLRAGHVKRIKEAQNNRKNKEVQQICPKCGGKLVYKRGKYGKFLGCTNYPNCRYTKEMK